MRKGAAIVTEGDDPRPLSAYKARLLMPGAFVADDSTSVAFKQTNVTTEKAAEASLGTFDHLTRNRAAGC